MKKKTTEKPTDAFTYTMRTEKVPIDAFAYELLHGLYLCQELYTAVCRSATTVLRGRYPTLDHILGRLDDDLADAYQVAGKVWNEESEKAVEAQKHADPR